MAVHSRLRWLIASMVGCPNCGERWKTTAYFCKFCGYPLREAKPSETLFVTKRTKKRR